MGKLFTVESDGFKIRFNPNHYVGRMLFCVRRDRDFSQQELVDKTNSLLHSAGAIGLPICGQSAVAKMEAGYRGVSYLEGIAIARVLGVPATVFAPWEDSSYDYKKPIDPQDLEVAKSLAYRRRSKYEIGELGSGYQIPEEMLEKAAKLACERGVSTYQVLEESLMWYLEAHSEASN